MSLLVVVPARMASTRFPGKPLTNLAGKPMILHVLDRIGESGVSARVIVATPDDEIAVVVRRAGTEVRMTRADHPSGTDRIAEAVRDEPEPIVLNVQGDEPLLDPRSVAVLAERMTLAEDTDLGTLWSEVPEGEFTDPAVVKVVTTADDRALYFSRAPIPHPRTPGDGPKRHIGIYAYRRNALEAFASAEPTPLELTEGLEQLRFLEMGFVVRAWRGYPGGTAVDTPEQGAAVAATLGLRA